MNLDNIYPFRVIAPRRVACAPLAWLCAVECMGIVAVRNWGATNFLWCPRQSSPA